MSRSRVSNLVRVLLIILVVVGLAAAAGVGSYLGTRDLRADDTPSPAAAPTPSAVAAAQAAPSSAAASAAPAVDRAALVAALTPALGAAGFGGPVLARVLDTASGTTLLDRSGAIAAAPASTAKIAVAVAALSTHRDTDRITTSVRGDGKGTITIVGAGDPTLTSAAAGRPGAYPGAGRLSDLATQLRRAGVRVSRILVDDRAFTGPTVSPDWAAEDVPSEYGAAITALMTDGGRAAADDTIRSTTPDLDAGRSLARLLGAANVPVTRGAGGGPVVARVQSATYGELVEQMLLRSDNVIAECLARRVAMVRRATTSFVGGAGAVRAVLAGLGVDPGTGMVDASGLAPRDRISPATLTALLRLVVTTKDQSVRTVAASLPVAGWSGSLSARFVTGSSAAGAGLVRAKTGTLTGVSTLAGLAHTRRGGLVAFAVFADRNTDTASAQAALDALVARLATCPC